MRKLYSGTNDLVFQRRQQKIMSFRYQKQSLYAEKNQVKVYEGVDPLTGLLVLIYEFPGEANPKLQQLESQNIPGLLDVHSEAGVSAVVVAFSKKYKALSQPLRISKMNILLDSARALRDAADAGVVHGDIRPQRFLGSQEHALLEGFGIPWNSTDNPYRAPDSQAASFSGDVYAWAKSVLDITQRDLPPSALALLERCLAPLAKDRPSARGLYDALNQSADAQPDSTFEPADAQINNAGGQSLPATPATPPIAAKPSANSLTLADLQAQEKIEAEHKKAEAKEAKKTFIKDLPPGATYKAGETVLTKKSASGARFDDAVIDFDGEPDGRARRRSIMLWITLVFALLLAGIAFYYQLFSNNSLTSSFSPPASESAAGFIVELDIQPRDIPLAQIVVISSPDGSTRPNNSVFGNYPAGTNQIALNQAGLWQFQGRFEDRRSEIISLNLPEQRRIVIEIPELEEEEP